MLTPLGDGILATLSSPEVFGLTEVTSNLTVCLSGNLAACPCSLGAANAVATAPMTSSRLAVGNRRRSHLPRPSVARKTHQNARATFLLISCLACISLFSYRADVTQS